MGFLDQFAVWQQVAGAVVIFGLLSTTLLWLLRRWNQADLASPADAQASDSNPADSAAGNSDAYAPMFRRIAPPSQPVPVAVVPETPRPGLSATTSPAIRAPTQPVPFTESPSPVSTPRPSPQPAPFQPAPFATPLTSTAARPSGPPTFASNPQRAVKIQPRTGASIGDISAKPVTASIGTRLSVLSLSVIDKPYAKPQLKPSESTLPVVQAAGGPDPTTVRAATPIRVFSREGSSQGAVAAVRPDTARASTFREMPPGTLSSSERPAGATGPVPTLNATTSRPSTSRIIPGQPGESDALSRFAAQMKSGGSEAASSATTPSNKPPVPAPRPMTATVPTVSPRLPASSTVLSTTGPNTVQLTIGFEISSLQLTPALKLGAVQIRPTSNIVTVQLDATSQATLQRLLAGGAVGVAPAFEIDSLQLTAAGKIAMITLAPKK
jgi:hypothetical protein